MSKAPLFSEIHSSLTAKPGLFNEISLRVFLYQYGENAIYRQFVDNLHIKPGSITHYHTIPFLPVSFFKSHPVTCFEPVWAERIYTSSGTTSASQSRHYVKNYSDYELSFTSCFEKFYGPINKLCILALLPGYLEREGSSLVEMAKTLMDKSGHRDDGFYLHNAGQLLETIERLEASGQKYLLLGVSFALLDLASLGPFSWNNAIVMETGGMKGRRKEIVREELHQHLAQQFGVKVIHSEYGMTELLSQAYSKGNGIFQTPPWMKIVSRDTNDPLTLTPAGKTGGLNIIDLANVHSCSFIATQDLGRIYPDGSFEVLGRFDNSDIRGCNLMVG